jgi:hypothetical protein
MVTRMRTTLLGPNLVFGGGRFGLALVEVPTDGLPPLPYYPGGGDATPRAWPSAEPTSDWRRKIKGDLNQNVEFVQWVRSHFGFL